MTVRSALTKDEVIEVVRESMLRLKVEAEKWMQKC